MTRPPALLLISMLVIAVAGLASLGLFVHDLYIGGSSAPQYMANFALLLTLAAVLAYVYYTYLLAKEAWVPSARFTLIQTQDPLVFLFLIQNHSKTSVRCWTNLNAKVCGNPVELEGFYGAKTPFDMQPFGTAQGWFSVREILGRAGLTAEQAKHEVTRCGAKGVLYLGIEFWYSPAGSSEITRNPRQPHYFDFTRNTMVMDF